MKIEKSSMQFIRFDAQDVIATSGNFSFTLAGLYDTNYGNATITYGTQVYTNSSADAGDAAAFLNSILGEGTVNGGTFFTTENSDKTLTDLFDYYNGEGDAPLYANPGLASEFSGVFQWISEESCFRKQ